MIRPKPRTNRSPKRSTNFPAINPEVNRITAKLEIMSPTKVFETPKDLAKIGIAGIIKPNPTATRNEIDVSTDTSLGKSLKGELNLIPGFRQLHPDGRLRVHDLIAKVFL